MTPGGRGGGRTRWPRTLNIALLAVALLASVAACEGFYADLPTATLGPEPTAAPAGAAFAATLAPEAAAEAGARAALAARLGIDPALPTLDFIRGATWTSTDPGCFPLPPDFGPGYLLPGLRVSLVYDGIRYEYHSDLPGTTGALCDSVPQEIAFTEAAELVSVTKPADFLHEVVVIGTLEEAQAFNTARGGSARIAADEIEWDSEKLVGTTIAGSGCSYRAAPTLAVWDIDAAKVRIQVDARSEGDCEQEQLAPLWVIVEDPPPGVSFEFEVTESGSPSGTPPEGGGGP